MLKTARRQTNRGRKSQSRPIPPSVGGWNARDALASMSPEDAVIMDNVFPKQSEVVSRNGCSVHCNTAEGTYTVGMLAEYKAGTQRKLIAALNGKLINVTTSTPSTIGSGFSSNNWKWVNHGGKIFFVNGTDAPQDWDGTTLTATAWSGLTIANLSDVCVFKERLFFIEKNTLKFWYPASVKTLTGALTSFDLSYVGTFGGTLQAIGKITSDGGDGVDDKIAFYLSSGEVIVYEGSDPGDATKWSLVGVFTIGAPVGAAVVKFGSDLVAITQGAYVQLTKVLPFGRTQKQSMDLSDKISGEVARMTRLYSGNTGWQATLYPKGRMLLFNVPVSSTVFQQHVLNIDTRAWCRFTGWNFNTFCLFNDSLYAGGTDGKIYLCDSGTDDNGEEIAVDLQTAWNFFGSTDQEKVFSMARVIMTGAVDPNALMAVGVDFEIGAPSEAIETEDIGSLGAIWGEAEWGVGEWSGAVRTLKGWNGIAGQGYCLSLRITMSLSVQTVTIQAYNVIMSKAGPL